VNLVPSTLRTVSSTRAGPRGCEGVAATVVELVAVVDLAVVDLAVVVGVAVVAEPLAELVDETFA
jgi:hypothetical protein